MPTRETEDWTTEERGRGNAGLGAATKQVAEHASALVRLEIELAITELKAKITKLGLGIGLGVGAAIFLLFMLGFAFATIAAALATAMPVWAGLLIVAGILLLIAGVLGVLAFTSIKKGTPPVPQQAIEEAKRTSEVLKSDGGT
jgi:Putative Actinobacterial Holin-X, holin superfamily III